MSSKTARKDKKYKDITAKQKGRIAEKLYRTYLIFYLEHGRMPDDEESNVIWHNQFQAVTALAPNAPYEDFEKVCQQRALGYEERILADIASGVTIESLQKPKRTKAEKAAIQKAKNEARRKRHRKKKLEAARANAATIDQDDTFFFIAGYTSGGAPYGVTWEEMRMRYGSSSPEDDDENGI